MQSGFGQRVADRNQALDDSEPILGLGKFDRGGDERGKIFAG